VRANCRIWVTYRVTVKDLSDAASLEVVIRSGNTSPSSEVCAGPMHQ